MADQLFDRPDGHSVNRFASSQTLLDTPINKLRVGALWAEKNLMRCPKLVDHYKSSRFRVLRSLLNILRDLENNIFSAALYKILGDF